MMFTTWRQRWQQSSKAVRRDRVNLGVEEMEPQPEHVRGLLQLLRLIVGVRIGRIDEHRHPRMERVRGLELKAADFDDMNGAEWNNAAVGPTKRALADELIRKLRDRFAPGGLLHYGQGKWYPGESLPRWAFGLYWRKDGVPIWKNSDLIAKIEGPHKAGIEDAERFAEGTAEKLGVDSEFIMPAFEDPMHRMQKEGELPENVDPENPKIDDRDGR